MKISINPMTIAALLANYFAFTAIIDNPDQWLVPALLILFTFLCQVQDGAIESAHRKLRFMDTASMMLKLKEHGLWPPK